MKITKNLKKWFFSYNGLYYYLDRRKMKKNKLNNLEQKINSCRKCPYGSKRNKLVFGEGNPDAEIIFIGEGPGRDEDKTGRPFVGRAGKLLRKIFKEEMIDVSNIYIANITKCRPFNNENPREKAVKNCLPYLEKQIEIINPKLLVALGRVPSEILTKQKTKITKQHGNIRYFKNYPVIMLYHPSYLLRNRGNIRMDEFRKDLNQSFQFIKK